ncbi:MAG: esterase family protein [bacterium]|nr:esterase family protein [bacterium]
MKKLYVPVFAILIFVLLLSCETTTVKSSFSYKGAIKAGSWLRALKIPYTADGKKSNGLIQMYFPSGYKKGDNSRVLILLHGYSGSYRQWEQNTAIESYANKYNIVLVCPNMGSTLYESKYYPETSNKWASIPGGKFTGEILISYLRNTFGLASDRSKTGIMGVSTGGRGALLLSSIYPKTFGVACGLSGDYSPPSIPTNRILVSVYGKYNNFKKRWEEEDNIIKLAVNLKNTPVYLWHGGKDSVVPRQQSMLLAVRLKQLQNKFGGYEITWEENKYTMHDWKYWRKPLPDIMLFFDKSLAK